MSSLFWRDRAKLGEVGCEAELGEDRGEGEEHRLLRMKPGLRAASSGITGLQPGHSGFSPQVDPSAAAGLRRSSFLPEATGW
jgi:hypothetical protein